MKNIQNFLLPFIAVTCIYSYATSQEKEYKPEDTEVWEPVPSVVIPGDYNTSSAPSDAIKLFDGTDLSQWRKPLAPGGYNMPTVENQIEKTDLSEERKPADWMVENGEVTVKRGAGPIETARAFGDLQLHIEWLSPPLEGKSGQGYSNSGIFLMSLYEIQVLNSYENETYPNGQAGSIYKQSIPLVNASRKPGEWQVYDIIWTAPVFNDDCSLKSPARITALHNGILIQNNFELKGPSVYIGPPEYVKHPAKMPLSLQDHGDPVRFRNIWVREL